MYKPPGARGLRDYLFDWPIPAQSAYTSGTVRSSETCFLYMYNAIRFSGLNGITFRVVSCYGRNIESGVARSFDQTLGIRRTETQADFPMSEARDGDSQSKLKSSGGLFDRVGRPVYIQIDLDTLTHNVNLHRECLRDHPKTEIMGVVKADATGHGATAIATHLKTLGITRIALATILEGIQLRLAGIKGPIHVFGNVKSWEMHRCLRYNLTPSVSDEEAVRGLSEAMRDQAGHGEVNGAVGDIPIGDRFLPRGAVNIKVDTGMNRNGCQPEELPGLIEACDRYNVPLDGIYSHFADYEDPEFTRKQMESFANCIAPYRDRGLIFHLAHAGGILNHYGTEYDFVRPGITLYGLPPGDDLEGFVKMGFRPIMSIKCYATMTKQLRKGSKVGYGCTYTSLEDEWIATLPIGFADGYWRHLANKGVVIRDKTGEKCPVVGKVSMDAITVRVPERLDSGEVFTVYTADFDPDTSVTGVGKQIGTNPQEICNRLPPRTPRVYLQGGQVKEIIHGLRLPDDIVNC